MARKLPSSPQGALLLAVSGVSHDDPLLWHLPFASTSSSYIFSASVLVSLVLFACRQTEAYQRLVLPQASPKALSDVHTLYNPNSESRQAPIVNQNIPTTRGGPGSKLAGTAFGITRLAPSLVARYPTQKPHEADRRRFPCFSSSLRTNGVWGATGREPHRLDALTALGGDPAGCSATAASDGNRRHNTVRDVDTRGRATGHCPQALHVHTSCKGGGTAPIDVSLAILSHS